MKNTRKHFIIGHGTYPFDIAVFVGYDHSGIADVLRKKGISEEDIALCDCPGDGRTVMCDGGQTVMILKTSCTLGQVAHEITHCVQFLFDRISLPYVGDDSHEAWAYQIQHVTDQFYRKIGKSIKR